MVRERFKEGDRVLVEIEQEERKWEALTKYGQLDTEAKVERNISMLDLSFGVALGTCLIALLFFFISTYGSKYNENIDYYTSSSGTTCATMPVGEVVNDAKIDSNDTVSNSTIFSFYSPGAIEVNPSYGMWIDDDLIMRIRP